MKSMFQPHRRISRIPFSLAILMMLAALVGGCRNKDVQGPAGTVSTGITGTVKTIDGLPIPGAAVTIGEQTVQSAANGTFTIPQVKLPKDRYIISCTKTGYFSQQRGETPPATGAAHVQFTLQVKTITHTLQADNGGLAGLPDGSGVELPAGGVVRADGSGYSGPVQMSLVHLDPTDPNFAQTIPGGDLQALRTDNSPVILYSYGMLQVEMESPGGEKLQLKQGKTSTLTMVIPDEQLATAPATIPLWHFDEAAGIWKEEGSATKTGNRYVGTVKHFSTWNCDDPKQRATIKGCVIPTPGCGGSGGAGVPGVMVSVGQTVVNTDEKGNYVANVPAGIPFEVSVEPRLNGGKGGVSQSFPGLAPLAVVTQDLSLPCAPAVTGRVTTCAGAPMGAFVSMYLDGENIGSAFTDENASFRLFAPKGKTVLVRAFDMTGNMAETTVKLPDNDAGKEIGPLRLCAATTHQETSFVIDGDGYSNRQWAMAGGAPTVSTGILDANSDETICVVVHNDNVLSLTFEGTAAGSYKMCVATLKLNNIMYTSETVNINVTRYGKVGEPIEGTFSGQFTRVGGGNVQIKNGKFGVMRIQG